MKASGATGALDVAPIVLGVEFHGIPPFSCVDEPAGEVHVITVAAIVSLLQVCPMYDTFPSVETRRFKKRTDNEEYVETQECDVHSPLYHFYTYVLLSRGTRSINRHSTSRHGHSSQLLALAHNQGAPPPAHRAFHRSVLAQDADVPESAPLDMLSPFLYNYSIT